MRGPESWRAESSSGSPRTPAGKHPACLNSHLTSARVGESVPTEPMGEGGEWSRRKREGRGRERERENEREVEGERKNRKIQKYGRKETERKHTRERARQRTA